MRPEGKATGFVNAQESSEEPSLDHWRCWEHKVLNQGELWNTIRLLTHPAADTVALQKPLTLSLLTVSNHASPILFFPGFLLIMFFKTLQM